MTIVSKFPKGWFIMFEELLRRDNLQQQGITFPEVTQSLAVAWRALYDVLPVDVWNALPTADVTGWKRAKIQQVIEVGNRVR